MKPGEDGTIQERQGGESTVPEKPGEGVDGPYRTQTGCQVQNIFTCTMYKCSDKCQVFAV